MTDDSAKSLPPAPPTLAPEDARRIDDGLLANARPFLAAIRDEIMQLESEKAALRAELAAVRDDKARLDWLEGEAERERAVAVWPRSLFRQNIPITRAAIDAARAASAPQEEPRDG